MSNTHSPTATRTTTTADSLTDGQVAAFRRDGFIRIPGLLSPDEAARFAAAATGAQGQVADRKGGTAIFAQLLQLWTQDDTLRELTFHSELAAIATRLAGTSLRLWHDQLLIKAPHNQAPTEFHQDQPFWPHNRNQFGLSAWVALVDVPVERGCMSFIPGSQRITDLSAQSLTSAESLFSMEPELAWEPRVTLPLRAGDCTFHHSFTAHTAASNATDDPRIAHVVAFTDADMIHTGDPHPITSPLDIAAGSGYDDEHFPLLPRPE